IAEKTCLVEIALGEVVGRSDKVYKTFIHIRTYFLNIIKSSLGDGLDFFTITAYTIQVAPSVTFAFPSEILVPFQPTHIVIRFQPCGILIGKDIDGGIFTYFRNPYFIGVLGTVHL